MDKLWVNDWHIHFCGEEGDKRADNCEDYSLAGSASKQYRYCDATITLYPNTFKDVESCAKTLLHELIHVQLAEVDLFYDLAHSVLLGQGVPNPDKILDPVWHHCIERLVWRVENMLLANFDFNPSQWYTERKDDGND